MDFENGLLLDLNLQFFAEPTMLARDAIAGSQGSAYVTIAGNRYLFASLINIEARWEKTKTQVPIMGSVSKGNKATGGEGTGSATFHYNTSIFRELMYQYQETGEDFYFDIQVSNDDKTSTVGTQTTILKDCNIDGITIAMLDADADYLEDTLDFTFEKFLLPQKFTNSPGMI